MAAIKDAAAAGPAFSVQPDRPSQVYFCDEDAVFHIAGRGPATIRFSLETVKILQEKKVTLDPGAPLALRFRLKTPGFLRCRVWAGADAAQPVAEAGVGFEPFNLRPTLPLPDDFNAFWRRAAARQAALPERLAVRRLRGAPKAARIYELSLAGLNNGRCYGYLGLPKGKKQFPLFAKVAWFGSPAACAELLGAFRGRAAVLVMRWQNFPAADTAPKDMALSRRLVARRRAGHFYLAGIANPAKSYLLGAILGCGRLLQAALGRPEIDARHVVYQGNSMEGDFGIFLAGLHPEITALACGGLNCGEPLGHRHGKPPSFIFRTYPAADPEKFRYFDAIAFAKKIACPALIYAGFLDNLSFATHQFPIYHALRGEKTMLCLPCHGHVGIPPEYQPMADGWIRQQLGL